MYNWQETLVDLLGVAGRRSCLPMVVCCSSRDELDAVCSAVSNLPYIFLTSLVFFFFFFFFLSHFFSNCTDNFFAIGIVLIINWFLFSGIPCHSMHLVQLCLWLVKYYLLLEAGWDKVWPLILAGGVSCL